MPKPVANLRCSFCGKRKDQVRKLIAGPGVFICDECVELCTEILDEERPRTSQAKPQMAEWVSSTNRRTPWWRRLFHIEGFEPA